MSNPFPPKELQICVSEHKFYRFGPGEIEAGDITESALSCSLAENKCQVCGKLCANIWAERVFPTRPGLRG